jgi:hypothetical protein
MYVIPSMDLTISIFNTFKKGPREQRRKVNGGRGIENHNKKQNQCVEDSFKTVRYTPFRKFLT